MEEKLCKHKGECWKNALKGLVLAAGQGLAVKAALHILLNFLLKRGYKRPLQSLAKLFSIENLRFGVFTGLMNFLYKSTLCLLRYYRKKNDGLTYLVAGGVCGLSILAEDKERRETWSLYFAARLVDILLRSAGTRCGGWNVNKIEVYLFMSMISFLLFCFTVEKDNMLRSYYSFLKMLYNPSKLEKDVMDVWSADSARIRPLVN
mmetsp:Transcript_405/g.703  ORF Transcript_405/g.703 Transcript_405/m.703 type:complete len:205 (+) Transcript_405:330-944(+)